MIKINEPLGQPQGTVRAILTIMLTGSLCVLGFLSIFYSVDFSNPALVGVITSSSVALGYYFGARTQETSFTPRENTQVFSGGDPLPDEDPPRPLVDGSQISSEEK